MYRNNQEPETSLLIDRLLSDMLLSDFLFSESAPFISIAYQYMLGHDSWPDAHQCLKHIPVT